MTTYRTPWEDTAPAVDPPAPAESPVPRRRGRRLRAETPVQPSTLRYFHLTISGPTPALAEFVAAAQGAGIVPWRHDLAEFEEDVFLRAMAVQPARRTLDLAGCRILARQFRDRVEAHHARAAARIGSSHACPFDLHALLPVPPEILQRGPTDPVARTWLGQHWGVTDRLRHVVRRPGATTGRRLPAGHGVAGYAFFSDGETPAAAIERLAARYASLRFALQPRALD